MKTLLCLFASLYLVSTGQLGAQSLDYNLGAPGETISNQLIFSSGGVTATATGWSASRSASNPLLQSSQLVRWSPGIGVKNSSEYISDVPYVPYYVDNQDHYDFVLFYFSQDVDISSVTVSPSAGTFDLDVSFWLGNVDSGLNLTGTSLANLGSLGFGSRIDNNWYASNSSRTLNVNSPTGGVNALLVGARVGGDSEFDRFKISAVTGLLPPEATIPEPTAASLLGLGLSLLILRRKR